MDLKTFKEKYNNNSTIVYTFLWDYNDTLIDPKIVIFKDIPKWAIYGQTYLAILQLKENCIIYKEDEKNFWFSIKNFQFTDCYTIKKVLSESNYLTDDTKRKFILIDYTNAYYLDFLP